MSQIPTPTANPPMNHAPPVPGDPLSTKSKVLESAAGVTQDFAPVKNICAHLNAFHCYADEPGTWVEANHYCSHISEDVRQCLIYDSPEKNARLIGVEYMITPKLYEQLDEEERKLWHSHVFEVKSGMLIMPSPKAVSGVLIPETVWEKAETAVMEDIIRLYGKTFHFWQIDKGHALPLGMPKLMGSFTEKESMGPTPAAGIQKFDEVVHERDTRFGCDWSKKEMARAEIEVPEIHPNADAMNVNSKRKKGVSIN